MTINSRSSARLLPALSRALVAAPICFVGACSQYIDPNVPEPIRPFVAPESGGEYLLYRPSNYDRRQSWPLVVVCHGSFPDSPIRQIREWTQHAEENGFLVVAPKLIGSRSWLPRATAERIVQEGSNKQRVLAAVRHVRAGHNVSEDRIFIHGWSDGGGAALRAGLDHPALFRAITLLAPKFDSAGVRALGDGIDPYQPIYLRYDVGDALTGRNAQRCAEWLRSHRAKLSVDSRGSANRSSTMSAVEFLRSVIRTEPWIQIRAVPAPEEGPLAIRFKLRCSGVPAHLFWEFGDGDTSSVAEPIHV